MRLVNVESLFLDKSRKFFRGAPEIDVIRRWTVDRRVDEDSSARPERFVQASEREVRTFEMLKHLTDDRGVKLRAPGRGLENVLLNEQDIALDPERFKGGS